MLQGRQIPADCTSVIDNYRYVWDATKGTAGSLDLLVVLVEKVDARLICWVDSGSALYRDTQDFVARWATCNEIDPGMVYVSAFKAPL